MAKEKRRTDKKTVFAHLLGDVPRDPYIFSCASEFIT